MTIDKRFYVIFSHLKTVLKIKHWLNNRDTSNVCTLVEYLHILNITRIFFSGDISSNCFGQFVFIIKLNCSKLSCIMYIIIQLCHAVAVFVIISYFTVYT